jgi:hypothetical protein
MSHLNDPFGVFVHLHVNSVKGEIAEILGGAESARKNDGGNILSAQIGQRSDRTASNASGFIGHIPEKISFCSSSRQIKRYETVRPFTFQINLTFHSEHNITNNQARIATLLPPSNVEEGLKT